MNAKTQNSLEKQLIWDWPVRLFHNESYAPRDRRKLPETRF
jgi:hypothetical protein